MPCFASPCPLGSPLPAAPAAPAGNAARRLVAALRAAVVGGTPPTTARLRCGVAALDAALGGGLAAGQMVAVVGPVGCGKSALGLRLLAAAQAAGQLAAWITAAALPPPPAAALRRCGAAPRQLWWLRPDGWPQALAMLARLFAVAGGVAVIEGAQALPPLPAGPQRRLHAALAALARRAGALVVVLCDAEPGAAGGAFVHHCRTRLVLRAAAASPRRWATVAKGGPFGAAGRWLPLP